MLSTNGFASPEAGSSNSARPSQRDDSPRDTDEDAKKVLRRNYRRLLEKVTADEDRLVDSNIKEQEGEIRESMLKADQLFDEVEEAPEALLDARVFRSLSVICRRRAEAVSANLQTFRASEFANKIVNKLSGTTADETEDGVAIVSHRRWARLGQFVATSFALTPPLTFLNGALNHVEVAKPSHSQRQRRAKINEADLVPTHTVQLTQSEESEGQTDALVTSTLRQLVAAFKANGKKPLCYFSFALDPSSFSVSVENLFHLSFLVKAFKVKVTIDEERGMPMIEPVSEREVRKVTAEAEGALQNAQVVVSITLQEWEALTSALKIQEAAISHASTSSKSKDKRSKVELQ